VHLIIDKEGGFFLGDLVKQLQFNTQQQKQQQNNRAQKSTKIPTEIQEIVFLTTSKLARSTSTSS